MTLKNNLQGLIFLFAAAVSLVAGITLQSVDARVFAFWIGIAVLWFTSFFLLGVSVRSTVIIISTFFLKPNSAAFFLSLTLLLFCWITDTYNKRDTRLILPIPFTFFILSIFGFISLIKISVGSGYMYFISSVLVPLIAFLTIYNARHKKDDLVYWAGSISVSALIVALYGIYIAIQNPLERLGSSWSNAMTINGFYTMAFFFSIALAANTKEMIKRAIWIFFAMIIFFGMVYTYTRIALVSVLFGLFLLVIKVRKLRLVSILAVGMMPLIIPSSMMQRITMGLTLDLSMIIRLIAWQKAIGIITQHPFTGIGFSTWEEMYHWLVPNKILYAKHAHNVYLNLAVEMGLIGAFAYFSLIFIVLKKYYNRVIKAENSIFHYTIFISILAILVACITDIFIEQYPISILFWITLAMIYRYASLNNRDST